MPDSHAERCDEEAALMAGEPWMKGFGIVGIGIDGLTALQDRISSQDAELARLAAAEARAERAERNACPYWGYRWRETDPNLCTACLELGRNRKEETT